MDSHLAQEVIANRKNGKTRKKVKNTTSLFDLDTPRDRASTFEPQLISTICSSLLNIPSG